MHVQNRKYSQRYQRYILWWLKGLMAYLCYKQANFRNVFSYCQITIYLGGWQCFTCLLLCKITEFKMVAICTNYYHDYPENDVSSPITMQIVTVIYGFVCLKGKGIRISQSKKHLEPFFCKFNCKRRFQNSSYDVYILSVIYICNVNSKIFR